VIVLLSAGPEMAFLRCNSFHYCSIFKFHYDLGKLLHSTCKGKEVGDVQFVIVSQINRGLQLIESHPSLRMEIVDLNMKAGNVGLDRSDFVTANSYFSVSLSLLPEDHWNSMYTFCRSLYFSVAKAAYSSANLEKAQKALQKIIDESKCLNEKLDALHLLVTVLVERDAQEQAFTTSFEVLLQLGETIPDSFDKRDARAMVKKTSKILGDISEESMSKMKEVDKKTEYILMFYNHISGVAFFAKPAMGE
jgi:predicted ATPase